MTLLVTDADKQTRTRTPRNADTITAGALSLSLKERVDLKNALVASIEKEVTQLKEAAKLAEETAKL